MFLLEGPGQYHEDLLNLFWQASSARNLFWWKIWQWFCHNFYPIDGSLLFCSQKYLHICRRILQTMNFSWLSSTEEGMPTTPRHSRRKYCACFQHCCSNELSSLTKASLTFLSTFFVKLQCIFLNSFGQSIYCFTFLFLSL